MKASNKDTDHDVVKVAAQVMSGLLGPKITRIGEQNDRA